MISHDPLSRAQRQELAGGGGDCFAALEEDFQASFNADKKQRKKRGLEFRV